MEPLLTEATEPPRQVPSNESPRLDHEACRSSSRRRTRVVVSQSKRGCLTCKARKVKCDEQKPLCGRCIRAGRICAGYSQAGEAHAPAMVLSRALLRPALNTGVQVDSSTERFSHLAAHVLSFDDDGQPLLEDSIWGRIFLQISNKVECVKAAAAAFGASYELWLNPNRIEISACVWRHYGSALAELRSAFVRERIGLESIALASMILACAEIMSQHEANALKHFLGAMQIAHKMDALLGGRDPSSELASIKDELVKVDILIGCYSLAQSLQIARFEGYGQEEPQDYMFLQPHLATRAAMHYLYRSRQFIETATRLRYKYPSWRDRDQALCRAQARLAVQSQTILQGLATLATSLQAEISAGTSTPRAHETLADVYSLRTQLTATMIYILCIHDPFQALYDEYRDLFQSIISDAAAVTRLRRRTKSSTLKRFSTHPGIIAPLFIVSMRCRDPSLRALATSMLQEQGREGPSDGRIAAAIGFRVAMLESPDGCAKAASEIPIGERLHGHAVFPGKLVGKGRRVVDVMFWRPEPRLAEGWGRVDYTDFNNFFKWKESIEI